MRNSKGRLTSLKNKLSDILPEGENLFGIEGINKAIILESIRHTYDLVGLLANHENTLECILFNRRLLKACEELNSFLKDISDNDGTNFPELLDTINELYSDAKQTYILITKEPIRLDNDIKRAKEKLKEILDYNNELEPFIQSISTHSKAFEEQSNKYSISISKADVELNDISSRLAHVVTLKKKGDTAYNAVMKAESEIAESQLRIEAFEEQIEGIMTKQATLSEELNKNKTEFESTLSKLNNAILINDGHEKNIQETIENANRLGMAASFKKRKDELSTPYWAWGISTVVTICVLICTSYNVVQLLKDKPFQYEYLLIRIPIFASFVWLGWFCAKQFGFVSRIREDYSFKYAVSMAFEGYKNATKEINADMLEHLLTVTLQNIASNPLNIYESSNNHGTPINEILSNWTKNGKVRIKKDSRNNIEEVEIENQETDEDD